MGTYLVPAPGRVEFICGSRGFRERASRRGGQERDYTRASGRSDESHCLVLQSPQGPFRAVQGRPFVSLRCSTKGRTERVGPPFRPSFSVAHRHWHVNQNGSRQSNGSDFPVGGACLRVVRVFRGLRTVVSAPWFGYFRSLLFICSCTRVARDP